MSRLRRPFAVVARHSRLAVAVLLVVSLAVGAGLAHLETGSQLQQYRGDSVEAAKLQYVRANFSAVRENATVAQVVVRDENAIDRETLLATLELQRAVRTNETIAPVLVADRPTVGLANVVGRAAVRGSDPGGRPTLDAQIDALESASDARVERLVAAILDGERALAFVPNGYEPGSPTANATVLAVFQSAGGKALPGQAPDSLVAAQQAMEALAAAEFGSEQSAVVGNGVVTAEQERARRDSFQLVGPLALLFVLLTLALAYRDLLDVALGLAGIGLVLAWTFGSLGWLGIPFSSLYVAIPVLLVGLSIDYAIHVFMRYREERADGGAGPRDAMARALPSVGVALVWVTLTTAVGFLSHLAGPIGPLGDIGVISAVGIVSALFVFGGLVPALKIEADAALERLGVDRAASPLGAGPSRVGALLATGVRAATRSPVALVLVALLVTGGAAGAATGVSTSFEPGDFMPGEAPDWMAALPAGLAPGDYDAKADRASLARHFATRDARAEVLVEGDVADPAVLERIEAARAVAGRGETVQVLASGEPRTDSPVAVLRAVAARNGDFAATLAAADDDGDGLPDSDVAAVYDALFAAAPTEARRVLYRAGGEYRAARLTVSVNRGASSQAVRAEMRDVAGAVEGPETTATATGEPVVRSIVQDELLATLVTTMLVTLLAVLALLAAGYRLTYGSATLGVVTLVPVGMTVVWIAATMAALGIPLSVLTALVASLTIGIGVDYAIHLSGRYAEEIRGGKPPAAAVADAVAGTGAALFGSALTTVAGFGVLALAVLPGLRQFGIVTAVTIGYAFLATVVVLPSLLVLWSRYAGLPASVDEGAATGSAVAAGDD